MLNRSLRVVHFRHATETRRALPPPFLLYVFCGILAVGRGFLVSLFTFLACWNLEILGMLFVFFSHLAYVFFEDPLVLS
jgi:hypothetical protein